MFQKFSFVCLYLCHCSDSFFLLLLLIDCLLFLFLLWYGGTRTFCGGTAALLSIDVGVYSTGSILTFQIHFPLAGFYLLTTAALVLHFVRVSRVPKKINLSDHEYKILHFQLRKFLGNQSYLVINHIEGEKLETISRNKAKTNGWITWTLRG